MEKRKELKKVIEDYLQQVRVLNSYGTIKAYTEQAKYIYNFLRERKIVYVDELTRKDLEEYVLFCRNKNICNNTINKRLNCLKRACKHAGLNITEMFFTLKVEYKTFGFLTEEETDLLIDYIVKSKMATKNKLLVLLALESGARKKELLEIKVSNIDKNNEIIFLDYTKEKRPRFICYGKLTKFYLDEVIASCKDDYLFDISSNSFGLIFKRIKKTLNLKKFSAYVLRHTYATILINNNGNLNMIMVTMGHKNIATTQRYLHYNTKLISTEYKKGFKIVF